MNAKSQSVNIPLAQNTGESRPVDTTNLANIRDLVQRFRVCWEVYPERILTTGEIRNVGFALELYGTHEPGTEHVSPGCEHCRPVQEALKEIAHWILPREERASTYEVAVDTRALTYSQDRGERPDVQVTIRILHRCDCERPVDDCEVRCLTDMKHALCEIGACKGRWTRSWQMSS